jgi:HYR domain
LERERYLDRHSRRSRADFDLTAPVLKGAVTKAVRAQNGRKSARVAYRVTASDNLDGALPVTCLPRSGSLFRIGRTTVRCTAKDKSGNTATAKFTVTVRR